MLDLFLYVLILIAIFFAGASFGSYGEVVRQRGVWSFKLSSRSKCNNCKNILNPKELIPIFSYVFLKGKCKNCNSKISTNHLIAELSCGSLFTLSYLFASDTLQLISLLIATFFIVPIVISDIEDYTVPEHLSLPFAFLGFIFAFIIFLTSLDIQPLINGIILSGSFAILFFVSKGKAMGLGDAKFALPLGFMVITSANVMFIFILSFWLGFLHYLLTILFQFIKKKKKIHFSSPLPLCPSIATAFYLVSLFDFSFNDVSLFISSIIM